MTLYTVTINKKSNITSYDMKGKVIGRREELIPQTYCDLPLAAANSYRALDNTAVVSMQDHVIGRDRIEIGNHRVQGHSTAMHGKSSFRKAAPAPVEVPAGTYTKVLNTILKEAV